MWGRRAAYDESERGGIRLTYTGQTPPWRIARRVRPPPEDRSRAVRRRRGRAGLQPDRRRKPQAMVSLYKYRSQVDLVLTDPPYNTGRDFRYNDKWDEDPNDPDLGKLVAEEDGSKHKWLQFMAPRVWMMREMLKPQGVRAICIDNRELFRFRTITRSAFRREQSIGSNKLAERRASKNNTRRVSQTTEYVLVYAKNDELVRTGLLDRSSKAECLGNPDADEDDWKQGDLAAQGASTHAGQVYRIQSPFTGLLHPPPEGRCWGMEKQRIRQSRSGDRRPSRRI